MVDYLKNTGSSGQMRIRDTGTTVEFWITAGNSSTFNHDMSWGYTVNGTTNNSKSFDYKAGSGWEYLGGWNVSTSQTVTFRLYDTGTSGLGGPTTFSVAIDRVEKPGVPSKPVISAITGTSMRVVWQSGEYNGEPPDLRQLARNTTNTTTGAVLWSVDGDTSVTGLTPNTTYYFWGRTHNSAGYSPWSPVASAKTLAVPGAPGYPVISDIKQNSFYVSFTPPASNGGSAILEYRLYYNTVPNDTGVQSLPYTMGTPLLVNVGLQPATTYYVWARARSAVGWGPYSEIITIRTVAGAWITVGSLTKEAVPYVNVGGVWKLAQPWSRAAGVWKETT